MRSIQLLFSCLLLLTGCFWHAAAQPSGATLFEGSRLIVGDSSAPMENSAFLVENNRFTKIGRKGQIQAPAGAAHVDLTGKTVMPALVNAHNHLGWAIIKNGRIDKDTYSRDNLIDHLRRSAYYGIGVVNNFGTDPGDMPFQLRAETIPDAALFRTVGRGMAMPNAGPGAEYWKPIAYGVTTETEARKAVRELAAKKVDIVKIWVDDRNGTVPKLSPALYKAIIDEAHKHKLRAAAHIFYLDDAKELLRSGIDGFTHDARDRDVDDEFLQLLKQKRNVFMTPNLPERGNTEEDFAFMSETVPAAEAKRLREVQAKRSPDAEKRARDFFELQSRNLRKVNTTGIRIILGTDSGTTVGWDAHQEMADMAASGMTPAQVITAATKTAAEVLKLDQVGTVAAGKSADFIVLDANPLDNISNTRKIAKVYLRGKELDRTAMRTAWTTP